MARHGVPGGVYDREVGGAALGILTGVSWPVGTGFFGIYLGSPVLGIGFVCELLGRHVHEVRVGDVLLAVGEGQLLSLGDLVQGVD